MRELLQVRFVGEPKIMRMVKSHRFWNKTGFVFMEDLNVGDKVYIDDFTLAEIESISLVDPDEGEAVYNLLIKNYHAYFAAAVGGRWKAISNSKAIGEL